MKYMILFCGFVVSLHNNLFTVELSPTTKAIFGRHMNNKKPKQEKVVHSTQVPSLRERLRQLMPCCTSQELYQPQADVAIPEDVLKPKLEPRNEFPELFHNSPNLFADDSGAGSPGLDHAAFVTPRDTPPASPHSHRSSKSSVDLSSSIGRTLVLQTAGKNSEEIKDGDVVDDFIVVGNTP
jgi:hemin uptake protein HemP